MRIQYVDLYHEDYSAYEIMGYFKEASKSQVGLMRYNYFHNAWGYIALSQLLDCGR